MPAPATRPQPTRSRPALSARATGTSSSVIRDLLRLVDRPGMLSLAGGLPAPEHLPVERLAEASRRVLLTAGPRALQYGPTEGMAELRAVVARRLGRSAPDALAPERIVITTGSQQAIDLVARSLLDPGDVVVVESPSYLGSLQSLRANGADLVAVPGDEHGLRVDLLAELLASRAAAGSVLPKLLYVVPNFANPTGATLSGDRRRELVRLACEWGIVLLEDDPYGELRWSGEREPSLAEIAASVDGADELVVSVGSASKVLAPGLRLGWLRGPAWLLDAVVRLKQSADLQTSTFDQLVAAEVLGDEAFLDEHLASIRATYAGRARVLHEAFTATLGDVVDVALPEGGMFLWARRRDGTPTDGWFERGVERGVAVVPGSAFAVGDPAARATASAGVRACFTTLGDGDLRAAVERLAGAV